MNWNAVGAIGEILGATGVIVSLLYLAIQVRADARARQAAVTHQMSEAFSSFMGDLANTPDLAGLWYRGIHDFDSLKGEERPRFSSLVGRLFRIYEDNYFQWIEGHLDSRVWHGLEASISDLVPYPGTQAWWATRSHWYSAEFSDFIRSKLSDHRNPTMYPEPAA